VGLSWRSRPLWAGAVAVVVASMLSTGAVNQPLARADQIGEPGSGGKAVAYYPGGARVRGKAARKAPDARMYKFGLNAAEPSLGLTAKGNVFYTAFQANARIEVMRGTPDGAKWDIVSPKLPGGRNAHLLSVDPYLYVDDAEGVDRIFDIDLTAACSYLSFSDDEGESWTTNPLACGQPVNDHQTLFAGPPASSLTVGYPNIVYYCWNDVATTSCSKSLDGGITFTRTGLPPYPGEQAGNTDPGAEGAPGLCGGLTGHGAVGPDGTVYIPRGWCGQPYLSISHDEGATWTQVQVAKNGTQDHETGIAVDSANNLYYTWMDRKMRLPYLAVSKDQGKTWSKPIPIGPPGLKEANIPAIDARGPGKVAISYLGSENSPGGPKFPDAPSCPPVGECAAPEGYENVTWNGYITMSANALSKKPVFYTATVNDPKDPLVRLSCGPGRCRAELDFIDVEIGPDGTPWAAFVDGCIAACVTGNLNQGSEGVAGRLVGGPRLR
jgi:BNR/Asp-box repeat protein